MRVRLGDFRTRRVALISLVMAGGLAAALVYPLMRRTHLPPDHLELERRAAFRFDHERGLTPCDQDTYEIVQSARQALRRGGRTDPALVAIVAPTFSGARVIAFGTTSVSVMKFAGETGFSSPAAWFRDPIGSPVDVHLPPSSQDALVAPLGRHIRYANTVRRFGLDGVAYLLDWGGQCATTWSPSPNDGPSALISEILMELSEPAPSADKLLDLAKEIDLHDSGLGANNSMRPDPTARDLPMLDVPPHLVDRAIAIIGTDGLSDAEIEAGTLALTEDPMLARRLIDWIPEAFGLVLVPHLAKVRLPTTFKARSKSGTWMEFEFQVEPIFASAARSGMEMYHSGSRSTFGNIALRSSTMVVVNKALNQGTSLEGAVLSGPAMIGVPADIYLPQRESLWRRYFR